MPKKNREPVEPSRIQPARKEKVTEYTDDQLGVDSERQAGKRWRYQGFEPDTHQPLHSAGLEVAGQFGKLLAAKKVTPKPMMYNGKLPISMTFGSAHGCGAGWYDETGSTYRVGTGSTAWLVLDEVGAVKGARDKAYYFTLAEIFTVKITDEYSRLAAMLIVVYYVNGTMITAYGLDPDGIIPKWLISAVIWWRMPVWKEALPHVCVASLALPVPLPLGTSGPFPIVKPPGDRDSAYVAGGVKADDDLKITSYERWEEKADPYFLADTGGEEDLPTILTPPAYNFYDDAPAFGFVRLLLVPTKRDDVIVVGASDAEKSKAVRWLKPEELDDDVARADLALSRECRTAFVAKRALVCDRRQHRVVPNDIGEAQPALACSPRMLLLFQREPLPLFVSEYELTKSGLKALRPPTGDEILHTIRNEYFSPSDLDEGGTQAVLRHRLEALLVPVDAHRVTVDVPLSLRQLFSIFCITLFDFEGDVLVWSFSEETEAEQHRILERLFGTRAVNVLGPRKRAYIKVLMASSGKHGVGELQFNMKTGIFTATVTSHRFNENGVAEAGATITPVLTPARGKKESDYRFDVVTCAWVLASKPIDHAALGAKFDPHSTLDDYFGMNGTEL